MVISFPCDSEDYLMDFREKVANVSSFFGGRREVWDILGCDQDHS